MNELFNSVVENLRLLSENCSSLQGFLITHSLGGGTGAGLTSRLIEKIAADYGNGKSKSRVSNNQNWYIWCDNSFAVVINESIISSNSLLGRLQIFLILLSNRTIMFCIYTVQWNILTVVSCLIMKHSTISALVLLALKNQLMNLSIVWLLR